MYIFFTDLLMYQADLDFLTTITKMFYTSAYEFGFWSR